MRPKTALLVLTPSEIIQSPTAKAIAERIGRARRQKAVSTTRQKREQLSTHKEPETAEPQKGAHKHPTECLTEALNKNMEE